MPGPKEQEFYSRLCASMNHSRLQLKPFREQARDTVSTLTAHNYNKEKAKKKTYVNLISLFFKIVPRNLIGKDPRVMLSTFDRKSQPSVSAMESWINDEIERLNLSNMFQRLVINALAAYIGICKVGIAGPGEVGVKPGDVYATWIDLDDWGFDLNCRDIHEANFMFHRYRMPLAMAEANPRFLKKARQDLTESRNLEYNAEGDQRIKYVGKSNYGNMQADVEPMVDLWEVYYRPKNCVYTFTDLNVRGASTSRDGNTVRALSEDQFIGPEDGPYETLGFFFPPGNPMPTCPVMDVIDLHDSTNEIMRKLIKQSSRQKSVLLGSSEDDIDTINKLQDGQAGKMTSPDKAQAVDYGGPNQGLFLFVRELIGRFNEQAGNLATLGGLSTQANTLGQEEQLMSQANGQMAAMQDSTYTFVSRVIKKMCWYWWKDPVKVMRTSYSQPGLPDIGITRTLHPWTAPDQLVGGQVQSPLRRDGEMPTIKVDPYSLRHATPRQRANDLTQFITQIYAPMAEAFMQQGVALDLNEFTRLIAKYWDMPELQNVVTFQEPPEQEPTEDSQGGGMPPETTRNYVRRSAGGGSENNQQAMMDATLASGGGKGMNGQLSAM